MDRRNFLKTGMLGALIATVGFRLAYTSVG